MGKGTYAEISHIKQLNRQSCTYCRGLLRNGGIFKYQIRYITVVCIAKVIPSHHQRAGLMERVVHSLYRTTVVTGNTQQKKKK